MTKYFKSKKRKRINKNTIIIIIILLIISIVFCLRILGQSMTPALLNIAEKEATKLATIVIKNSISVDLIKKLDTTNIFINNQDSNANSYDINTAAINTFMQEATINIQKNLKYLEEGKIDELSFRKEVLAEYDQDNLKKGIFQRISSGIVFNNPIIISLSPKIPLKFTLIGNTTSDVDTKVTNYGINNALVQINLNISVNLQILLPVTSKEITVTTSFPLTSKLIQGEIPSYYYNGLLGHNNSYTLPN